MAITVDEDLVRHEVAHTVHLQRHRGDAIYCASDQEMAKAILDLFKERGWRVFQERSRTEP